jgi:hypothetical protein
MDMVAPTVIGSPGWSRAGKTTLLTYGVRRYEPLLRGRQKSFLTGGVLALEHGGYYFRRRQ